jgi:hypothetical protein
MVANSKTGDFSGTTYRAVPRGVQHHARDTALGLAPGTTEIQHGTNVSGAAACPSAKLH